MSPLPACNPASRSQSGSGITVGSSQGASSTSLEPPVPPQVGAGAGHQGCSHGLTVLSPRAGPGHVTKVPEAAPPCLSGVLGPGLWVPVSLLCLLLGLLVWLLCSSSSLALGSLSKEPLVLLLPSACGDAKVPLPPAVAGTSGHVPEPGDLTRLRRTQVPGPHGKHRLELPNHLLPLIF